MDLSWWLTRRTGFLASMRIWAVRKKVKIKGGCSATQTYKSRESLDGVSEYEP